MRKNKGYEERRKLRHLFQVKYHFKVLTLLCLISKKEVFWKIRCCKLNQLRTVETNNFNLDLKKKGSIIQFATWEQLVLLFDLPNNHFAWIPNFHFSLCQFQMIY